MITQIAAVDLDGGIGKDGGIPWKAKADLRRFKELTLHHPIIMGRKTFASLPKRLPDREHIVVSRTLEAVDGCSVVPDLEQAVMLAKQKSADGEIFVIGGSEIYAQSLAATDRILLTVVQNQFWCDVRFPEALGRDWRIIPDGTSPVVLGDEGQPSLVFLRLEPYGVATDPVHASLPYARRLEEVIAYAHGLYYDAL